MTESIPRRTLLALAGIAGAALPALARAQRHPASQIRNVEHMSKQVVEISKDNPIFGESVGAFAKYGYSPAVRAGGLLFSAGVVGAKADGTIAGTVEEQAELAFRRTAEILRLQGLTMADLIDVTSYHVDLPDTLPLVMPVKERYFQKPYPTWTIIGVAALASPLLKLEIRSVAALRN